MEQRKMHSKCKVKYKAQKLREKNSLLDEINQVGTIKDNIENGIREDIR